MPAKGQLLRTLIMRSVSVTHLSQRYVTSMRSAGSESNHSLRHPHPTPGTRYSRQGSSHAETVRSQRWACKRASPDFPLLSRLTKFARLRSIGLARPFQHSIVNASIAIRIRVNAGAIGGLEYRLAICTIWPIGIRNKTMGRMQEVCRRDDAGLPNCN